MLVCCVVVGCSDILGPLMVPSAERFRPEELDERGMLNPSRPHYDAMVACSGMSRPYERIQWFRVRGEWIVVPGVGLRHGLWIASDAIYLSDVGRFSARVKRHELLHYLYGTPGHPERLFGKAGVCAKELGHLDTPDAL